MDAIAKFRVATDGTAEFGRMTGANVALVTKSGTNDLHGALYEYLRNDDFDANNFFSNAEGLSRTPYHQNQFGVAMGGPVVIPKLYSGRNRTFWFASYEGYRSSQAQTSISTVPTVAEAQGNFNGTGSVIYDPATSTTDANGNLKRQPFSNNTIPVLGKFVPASNRAGITNNYLDTQPLTTNYDIGVARVDQYIDEKNNVFFRILDQNVNQIAPQSRSSAKSLLLTR